MLLAYRYGLRPLLALGLGLLLGYGSACLTARLGYNWLDFLDRPEHFALLGLAIFAAPLAVTHQQRADFPAVYRLVGALAFFVGALALSEGGAHSYLPLTRSSVEVFYEVAGLTAAAGSIWLGIVRASGTE